MDESAEIKVTIPRVDNGTGSISFAQVFPEHDRRQASWGSVEQMSKKLFEK